MANSTRTRTGTGTVRNALVIGGGLGGMCCAIELRKRGVPVDLVELNPDWAVYGAGITLSSPTLRALRTVGVADEVLARGGHWSTIDLCAADGTLLNAVPMSPAVGAETLPGAAGILRPVLAQILSRVTRESGTAVRLGVSFAAIEPDVDGADGGGGGVTVRCTDGQVGRYDLVIGADGVHSKVREALFPDAPVPRFTGQGSWRAVVPRSRAHSTVFFGQTTKAGLNPVSDTESYLYVLDQRERADFIPAEQWPSRLADLLAEFGGPIGDIRRSLLDGRIGPERIVYRPLLGLMTPAPWHRGRVVLLGDAVHATTPHLASGAGIAIEGALVLAQELARDGVTVEAALTAYARRCEARARLVVESSLRLGEIEQTGGDKDEHRALMFGTMKALNAAI